MFLPLNKTLIIAEAGINHDGDFEAAKKHVDAAVAAGADFVKFQSFVAEELVLPEADRSTYIIEGSHEGESFRDLLKRLELNRDQQRALNEYCKERGIKFSPRRSIWRPLIFFATSSNARSLRWRPRI